MVSGVDDGARTHDRRDHNPELCQLSYVHHRLPNNKTLLDPNCANPGVARPAGLEPATLGLEGRCSIRLSYGRIATAVSLHPSGRGRGIRTPDPLLPKQMRYQTAPCPAMLDRPAVVARPLLALSPTADPHGRANHTDRPPQRQFRIVAGVPAGKCPQSSVTVGSAFQTGRCG